jgi:hypothetical protein
MIVSDNGTEPTSNPVLAWCGEIGGGRDPFSTGVLTMADKNEVVVRGSAAGFAQEILAGRHRLTADEPVTAGGADTGPTPYDLLLAALGA